MVESRTETHNSTATDPRWSWPRGGLAAERPVRLAVQWGFQRPVGGALGSREESQDSGAATRVAESLAGVIIACSHQQQCYSHMGAAPIVRKWGLDVGEGAPCILPGQESGLCQGHRWSQCESRAWKPEKEAF